MKIIAKITLQISGSWALFHASYVCYMVWIFLFPNSKGDTQDFALVEGLRQDASPADLEYYLKLTVFSVVVLPCVQCENGEHGENQSNQKWGAQKIWGAVEVCH